MKYTFPIKTTWNNSITHYSLGTNNKRNRRQLQWEKNKREMASRNKKPLGWEDSWFNQPQRRNCRSSFPQFSALTNRILSLLYSSLTSCTILSSWFLSAPEKVVNFFSPLIETNVGTAVTLFSTTTGVISWLSISTLTKSTSACFPANSSKTGAEKEMKKIITY